METATNANDLSIANLCSFLLIFTPEELTIIATILAIIITRDLTIEEQTVIGAFLTALADNILLITAQLSLINAASSEQKELIEKQKAADTEEVDIYALKKRVDELEKLLKNQKEA